MLRQRVDHKCDFSPPDEGKDAGPDAALACGTQMCGANQECCITKTPPFVNCIDPKDFIADQCEMFQLQTAALPDAAYVRRGHRLLLPDEPPSLSCQKPAGLSGGRHRHGADLRDDRDCPNSRPACATNWARGRVR